MTGPATERVSAGAPAQRYSARSSLFVGLACIVLLVGGLTAWSLEAEIAGAVIANGEVAIAAGNQPVEHIDGGAVTAVHVRDGDHVGRGDPLVRFAEAALRDELASLALKHHGLVAQRNRLEAEHRGDHSIVWDESLLAAASADPAVQALLDSDRAAFDQRLESHQQQIAIMEARVARAQAETARLEAADALEARNRIAEMNTRLLQIEADRRSGAEALLVAARPEENLLRDRMRRLSARLERTTLHAPTDGVVFGLAVTGPGDVVFAGEPLLQIVPEASALIVRARIRPIDIDQVFVGQEATVRFAAFPYRSSPERTGRVCLRRSWQVSRA